MNTLCWVLQFSQAVLKHVELQEWKSGSLKEETTLFRIVVRYSRFLYALPSFNVTHVIFGTIICPKLDYSPSKISKQPENLE